MIILNLIIKIFNFKIRYSKQGGFEIHVENIKAGLKLYDHMFKVGKEFNIKAGCPNIIERTAAGFNTVMIWISETIHLSVVLINI